MPSLILVKYCIWICVIKYMRGNTGYDESVTLKSKCFLHRAHSNALITEPCYWKEKNETMLFYHMCSSDEL